MKSKPHFADRSPHGWWIASFIEQAVWDDEPNPSVRSRCVAWENTVILKAADREAAYEKARRIGSEHESEFDNCKGRTGRWKFLGLTSLLPIYEELEDGAEVIWREHVETVGRVKSRVRRKRDLEVFRRGR